MKYQIIKYKELLVGLVRQWLSIKHEPAKVTTILSGWNYASRTEQRNKHIEEAVQDLSQLMLILDEFKSGTITNEQAIIKLEEILHD